MARGVSVAKRTALPSVGTYGEGINDIAGSVGLSDRSKTHNNLGAIMLHTILLIAAVILVIAGIWRIVQKDILWGIVLIVLGLLVGPGGVSIFS